MLARCLAAVVAPPLAATVGQFGPTGLQSARQMQTTYGCDQDE
ncbi:hypothetical protein [Crateriforma conspicua]|nr:hypothetical protein [Crateriforma conspicua]QDV65977.1 hypothetical protein Mal65_51500 [Crateriforma conspicua]